MLKITLISIAVIVCTGCASLMKKDATEDQRKLEGIYDFTGKSKDDLYIAANTWFVNTFTEAESVIQFSDKEAGRVMGKYILEYAEGVYTYNCKCTITVDVKDEKARIMITDPLYCATSGMGQLYPERNYDPLYSAKTLEVKVYPKWQLLLVDFETSLASSEAW